VKDGTGSSGTLLRRCRDGYLDVPYQDFAQFMSKRPEEAARMAVDRALVRLANEMGRK